MRGICYIERKTEVTSHTDEIRCQGERNVEFGRLVDWVEGRLPEDEARAVEEQVARADSRTLADVAWLRKFVKATDNAVLESPPREVRDALIARFEAYANGQRTPGY